MASGVGINASLVSLDTSALKVSTSDVKYRCPDNIFVACIITSSAFLISPKQKGIKTLHQSSQAILTVTDQPSLPSATATPNHHSLTLSLSH
ncbi:hypothetical protein RIF29_18842 [Crotalaria pallida]|uniref:Uncharacterized protein n=1 Tax=Crotalaria pallida TaxID=3830 RepID=A0AAN9I768_CROPI